MASDLFADEVLCEDLQRELGLTSISAAQLSRKHKQVDPELLRHVFEQPARRFLSRQDTRAHRSKIKIIDLTTVTLWTVTATKKNDRTQMNELVHEPGVTYVFDRGYIDYAAFDRYCFNGIFFVTRLASSV